MASKYAALLLICIVQVSIGSVQNVHLALTGNPTEMVVSWLSEDWTEARVHYGETKEALDYAMDANYTYYGAEGEYGYNFNAILTGLKPSTKYYYTCIGSKHGNASFTTAPASAAPFKIAVYADMGVENSQGNINQLTNRVQDKDIDFIWHVGDISYANEYKGEYETVWSVWFEMVENITSSIPYMTSVGNHEWSCDKHSSCFEEINNFTAYRYKFRMPSEESHGSSNMYFSFDYGLAHFVSISSETGYPGSPYGNADYSMVEWLEKDLEKANQNRDAVPWIFVGSHRPMYTAHQGSDDSSDPKNFAPQLQAAFERMINDYKVNIFFSGHKHHYERQWPVFLNVTQGTSYTPPKSTVHLLSGAGGNIEGLVGFDKVLPDWFAFGYDGDFGYGTLDVKNSTHLEWEFYTEENELIDSLTITNWSQDNVL